MSGLPISRLICSHDFYWSRRRQADVCRRCGALSPVLALHFRSKSAWTVGADLPPERMNGFAPAVDVEIGPQMIEAPPQLAAPGPPPLPLSEVAAPPAPEVVPPEPAGPVSSDPFSIPVAAVSTHIDFSSRAAAPLQKPLVR